MASSTALDTRTSLYRRFHASTSASSTGTDTKPTTSSLSSFPLRRLASRTTSTYSQSNPFETASTISTVPSTSASLLSHASSTTLRAPPRSIARTKLQIQCNGHAFWALPLPLKELETHIYSITDSPQSPEEEEQRRQGLLKGPRLNGLKYISVRPERSKGNCALFWADDRERAVARTSYRWGPRQHPMVRVGADDDLEAVEVECRSKWTSKAVQFEYHGRSFEWRYGDKKERLRASNECEGESIDSVLMLEHVGLDGKRKVIARLIRGEDSRTPGTKKSDAGNGGRLELSFRTKQYRTEEDPYHPDEDDYRPVEDNDNESEVREGEEDTDPVIDEVAVIATCLVMLKKEVDNMRGWQMAAIGENPSFLPVCLRY